MGAKVTVKINRAGVRALLTGPEMQADLARRAAAIAEAAGEGMVADAGVTGSRARAAVITQSVEAMRAEAEDRALTRALDAGRG